MLKSPILNEAEGVRHAFFTREGGVSEGIYASLNCGAGSEDKPEHVLENKRRAAARLDLPEDRLVTLYQVHSPEVVEVTTPESLRDNRPQADAMVTRSPDIALGILTADCAPVLFADAKNRVIGAAHAGWKGALAGVLESTIAAMENLGADRTGIRASIGPCIAQSSYQVGPEFPEPFLKADETAAEFFRPDGDTGKYLFDLTGYVLRRLERSAIGRIDALAVDTYDNDTQFFSYRRTCHRSEADYGRGLSAIALARTP
jgi:YfiH family protein